MDCAVKTFSKEGFFGMYRGNKHFLKPVFTYIRLSCLLL